MYMNRNIMKLSFLLCLALIGMLLPVYGAEDIRKSDTFGI